MTASGLLRSLIDLELAGRPAASDPGEAEAGVRADLASRAIPLDSGRAAAAINIARRLDRDPVSGPANSNALRAVLDQLIPMGGGDFDPISFLRLCLAFDENGWTVYDKDGRPFDLDRDLAPDAKRAFIRRVSG